MGLLDKAKSDREAGRPQGGAGLFSKAQEARAAEAERTVPAGPSPRTIPFPYSPAEIAELGDSLLSSAKSKDWIAAMYEEISDNLDLEGLALFLFCADGAYLAARRGFCPAQQDLLPPNFVNLDVQILGELERGGRISPQAAEAFLPSLGSLETGKTWAFLARAGDNSPFLLWIYSDSRLAADSERLRALDSLFRSPQLSPVSPGGIASPKRLDLEAAIGDLVPMRTRFFAFLFSTGEFGLALEERIPGMSAMAFDALLLEASREILGSQGRAALIAGEKLLAILPCRQTADAELGLVQFSKSLKRSLPFMTAASFPEARAMALDLASTSGMGELADFISG